MTPGERLDPSFTICGGLTTLNLNLEISLERNKTSILLLCAAKIDESCSRLILKNKLKHRQRYHHQGIIQSKTFIQKCNFRAWCGIMIPQCLSHQWWGVEANFLPINSKPNGGSMQAWILWPYMNFRPKNILNEGDGLIDSHTNMRHISFNVHGYIANSTRCAHILYHYCCHLDHHYCCQYAWCARLDRAHVLSLNI